MALFYSCWTRVEIQYYVLFVQNASPLSNPCAELVQGRSNSDTVTKVFNHNYQGEFNLKTWNPEYVNLEA